MRFPSIRTIASALRDINREAEADLTDPEAGVDVRLQIEEDGCWTLHSGDAQYDQSHKGYWGSSSVPGNGQRFKSQETARDLLEQVKDDYVCVKS
jgi:hypothetical protein